MIKPKDACGNDVYFFEWLLDRIIEVLESEPKCKTCNDTKIIKQQVNDFGKPQGNNNRRYLEIQIKDIPCPDCKSEPEQQANFHQEIRCKKCGNTANSYVQTGFPEWTCRACYTKQIGGEPEQLPAGELQLSDEFVEALIKDINQSQKLKELSNKAIVELLANRVWGKLRLMTFESNLVDEACDRIDRLEAELAKHRDYERRLEANEVVSALQEKIKEVQAELKVKETLCEALAEQIRKCPQCQNARKT